jgi:hypothetical protein
MKPTIPPAAAIGTLAQQARAALEDLLAASRATEPARAGLLGVVLGLVFVRIADARGLLREHPVWALQDRLRRDAADPARLSTGFTAWPSLRAALLPIAGLFAQPGACREDPEIVDDGAVHRLLERLLATNAGPVDIELLGRVYEALTSDRAVRHPDGRLSLRPGPARRRTTTHYTPRALAESLVRTTLGPQFTALGPAPTSDQLLSLKICDPAMGCGALLLAVVRLLADELVAAWTREGRTAPDLAPLARRLVAERCIHGVDSDPIAAALARLSLWLAARTPDLPLTAFDHTLRCGDALVGLTDEQIDGFHWAPSPPIPAIARASRDQRRRIADLAVDAFFAATTPRARERERHDRLAIITTWLAAGGPPPAALLRLQAELHATRRPFHWPLEFPGTRMDAVVGNPPFMGGGHISGALGDAYLAWLLTVHPGAHGNADLAAHFLRRADTLLAARGAIGMIATNTIGQGDTRATGLQHLVTRRGYTIHAATRDLRWPDAASVTVALVHLARDLPFTTITLRTPDPTNPNTHTARTVPAIDSRLHPARERPDPAPLASNQNLCYLGSKIYGQGLIISPAERSALIARSPHNAARIAPYIGGEEINTHPEHMYTRYVIDFAQMTLAEAERWPDLLAIVRERVQPVRERLSDNTDGRRRKHYWWQFGRYAAALTAAIRPLPRCLVVSGITKHLVFAFQPTDRVFSHKLFAFPLSTYTAFAVLQSRVHAVWAWRLSSTMKTDLNYTPSDCFETFPFPAADPRTRIPTLEQIGERLHAARAAHMRHTGRGLTRTYNQLTDPACTDPAILVLRALHRELDRAVLAAYGWADLDGATHEPLLDRLHALNAARAAS